MSSSTDPEIIASGIKALRRRRRIFGVIAILTLLSFILTSVAISEESASYIIPFGFLLLMFVATANMLSECPRCGELFHLKGLFLNASTKRCLHCDLPLKDIPAKSENRRRTSTGS